MNDNNVFLKKMKNESYNEFIKCIPVINSEEQTKKAFHYFLYYDIINIKKNNNEDNNLNNISDILNDPLQIIDKYFDEIKDHISNLEDEYIKELKKFIINKKKKVNASIKECEEHIEILKKIYINLNFVKILPNSQNIKLNFDKKSVILTDNIIYNDILGEFFGRFLFNSVKISLSKNNSLNSNEIDFYSKTSFYNEDIINSYYDKTNIKIKNFDEIDINFKYWIILIILINNLFTNKSNYNLLFNQKEFENSIIPLVNTFKSNGQGSKKGKKDKKGKKGKKGGYKDKKDIFKKIIDSANKGKNPQQKKQNPKDPQQKKQNPRDPYLQIFNMTKIFSDKKLKNIYIDPYNEIIAKIFNKQIDDKKYFEHITTRQSKDILLNDPFILEKEFNLKSILNNQKDNIKESEINGILKNINFDIFRSLFLILDNNNEKQVDNFFVEIRYKLILLLYYLYNLKKYIYKYYFDNIDDTFDLTKNNYNTMNKSSENNNNSSENNNKSYKKNNKLSENNNKSSENNNEKEYNTNNIFKKIKLLEKKKESIKNNIGIINRDKILLNIENQIKKLLIEKYNNNQKIIIKNNN